MNDDTIDLDAVRRGDEHLSKAKRLHDEQGRTPRPVPTQEIAEMTKQTFTTEEVANLLDVDIQTVRRWCREGELTAAKMGRNYRISRPDLAAFYRERGGGELFDGNSTGSETMELDALKSEGEQAGREAASVAADVDALDPDNFPLPGDWRWLRSELGREPTDREREVFAESYRGGMEAAKNEGDDE